MSYLCKGTALDVLNRFQLFRKFFTLFSRYRLLFVFREFLDRRGIVSQIDLSTDQQERSLLTVMRYFWNPLKNSLLIESVTNLAENFNESYLLLYVFERRWRYHGETYEKYVGLWITQRT